MNQTILIIDDDPSMQSSLSKTLTKAGYQIFQGMTIHAGRELFQRENPDLVLLDLKLPDGDGREFFDELHDLNEETPVMILTAFPDMKGAISLMRKGAFDYLVKPFDLQELKLQISKALEMQGLKKEVAKTQANKKLSVEEGLLIGESEPIKNIKGLIPKLNYLDSTILITGESGTGKEVVAHAIHNASNRSAETLVCVNCAAIPGNLLEAELFGTEKGAFTGATVNRKGLFELAHKGTLFLDEIGEMPIELQPKLLRVLESLSIKRVGGSREIQVDVRLIAASNRNFTEQISLGRFREDLFYRLNVIPVALPPLRERDDDVLILAELFLSQNARKLGIQSHGFSEAVKEIFRAYPWPGNVRELKNIIERLVIINRTSESIEKIDREILPAELLPDPQPMVYTSRPTMEPSPVLPLVEVERNHIMMVLEYCDHNISQAARLLGITRNTLKKKITP